MNSGRRLGWAKKSGRPSAPQGLVRYAGRTLSRPSPVCCGLAGVALEVALGVRVACSNGATCPRCCARRWLGERRAGRRLGEDGTSLPLARRSYWRRGGRDLWLGDAAARLTFNLSTRRLTAMIPGGGNKVLPVRGRKESYPRRCFFFIFLCGPHLAFSPGVDSGCVLTWSSPP